MLDLSTRIGFYDVLKKYKAKIKFLNLKKENNEVKGDIIANSSELKPMNTNPDIYPKTTDEYLLLFVLAGLTKGVSTFKGISDLSNKESSRAYEMKKILDQLGIKSKLSKNEMKIYGKGMIDASKKNICQKSWRSQNSNVCFYNSYFDGCENFDQRI